jgi:hypothetical protein
MEKLNVVSKESVLRVAVGVKEDYRRHLGTVCDQKQVQSEEFGIINL